MTAGWEEREDHPGIGDLHPAIQTDQQTSMTQCVFIHYKPGFTHRHRRGSNNNNCPHNYSNIHTDDHGKHGRTDKQLFPLLTAYPPKDDITFQ